MKNMKKMIVVSLLTGVLICLSACGSQSVPASSSSKASSSVVQSSSVASSSAVPAKSSVVSSSSQAMNLRYTDEDLCKLASNYYLAKKGQKPPITEIDHKDGNIVTIHLYEIAGDHTATWDWYEVDITTGKAKNFMGESFELFKVQ
ncbi:MAG: hypothetical protein IK054_01920 [Lachnospiraceae bacterium]|nr:hypothetical protein [Lachnospiraceae bacterium]MBR4807412.1 hypothetical protein [Lachnospiraceae bacterium]